MNNEKKIRTQVGFNRLRNKDEQAGELAQKEPGSPSKLPNTASGLSIEKQGTAPIKALIPQPVNVAQSSQAPTASESDQKASEELQNILGKDKDKPKKAPTQEVKQQQEVKQNRAR